MDVPLIVVKESNPTTQLFCKYIDGILHTNIFSERNQPRNPPDVGTTRDKPKLKHGTSIHDDVTDVSNTKTQPEPSVSGGTQRTSYRRSGGNKQSASRGKHRRAI